MDRRNFIKKSMLVGAGAVIASNPLSKAYGFSPIGLNKKAICIGAGFAGLAAAYQLKLKGWDVLILESRNRIGGRVFSHLTPENHVIELGAEWVGASHSRLIELCDQFKLKLNNNQFDTHKIYQGQYTPAGKWSYSKSWEEKFQSLLENFRQLPDDEKKELDQLDWWRYLVNNGCSDTDLDLHELIDSTDFGESIRHVSASAAIEEYAESSEKNEMDYKIEGGNGKLAEKLAEQIGQQNIYLSHTVTHIDQKEKVKITCSNGKTFQADKLICTMPTFAMQKVKWSPELPTEKTKAINELQYARINKHAMSFSERFWKEENFDLISDETSHYFYHATKNQKGPSGVLISYSIGEKAAIFGNRAKEKAVQDVFSVLEPHFGSLQNKLKSQVNYYWGTDKYSMGAYALYGVNQWHRLRPILSEPFLHTHFAGEHLADWQGFMEGALVTGEEAANQITS